MNGPHDVGGMMGFGPIDPEPDEPYFHATWEQRVLGMTLCAGALGHWNLDESRHARENRHPADYYQSSYYEIWQKGLERLLVRHGVVTDDELAAGRSLTPGPESKRILTADRVPITLRRGGPVERPATTQARFAPGDRVATKVLNPHTHTRLPRYARGKVGVVERVHGCHVFPDSNAHGHGENPQWLYNVCFDGRELWGADAEAGLSVSIDAWEPYLDPV
ncbi:MAG: nitrile hydratase subunit beta [Acidimicrobiia bacterium]|nr:nitrile hydratase subunit beta [Acidimicrobiia bacterium]